MKLEWNTAKRDETLTKRGLDFADVAFLDWDTAMTRQDDRRPYPETRFVTYGMIRNRLCVLAWCIRNDALRVISLRKANKREIEYYEGN